MAIGSAPEIGETFGMWKDMDDTQRKEWFEYMRTYWRPNLLNGYATVHYIQDKVTE